MFNLLKTKQRPLVVRWFYAAYTRGWLSRGQVRQLMTAVREYNVLMTSGVTLVTPSQVDISTSFKTMFFYGLYRVSRENPTQFFLGILLLIPGLGFGLYRLLNLLWSLAGWVLQALGMGA